MSVAFLFTVISEGYSSLTVFRSVVEKFIFMATMQIEHRLKKASDSTFFLGENSIGIALEC